MTLEYESVIDELTESHRRKEKALQESGKIQRELIEDFVLVEKSRLNILERPRKENMEGLLEIGRYKNQLHLAMEEFLDSLGMKRTI